MNLTPDEAYFVEHQADMESSRLMQRFLDLVSIPISNLDDDSKRMLQHCSSEIIDAYIMLKELRIKLEMERKSHSLQEPRQFGSWQGSTDKSPVSDSHRELCLDKEEVKK